MSALRAEPRSSIELVDQLLSSPRGRIVVCNLLDGYAEHLFDGDDLCEFVSWWCASLPIVEATPSPLIRSNPLFITLDLLRLAPDLWVKLDSTYPGLASLGAKPDFRVVCRRPARKQGANGKLLTTLDTEGFFTLLAADVKNQLLGLAALDTTSDRTTLRAVVGGVPKTARTDRLRDGTHLGCPGGLLWYTTSESVEDLIRKRDADATCDCLGLAHIDQGTDMLAIEFDASALRIGRSGRPTAMDAGGHRRFKARADGSGHRRRTAWGYTADLAKLKNGERISDGVPERISYPMAEQSLGSLEVRPIGRTALTRRGASLADDPGFGDRLARGRDEMQLKQSLLALLQ